LCDLKDKKGLEAGSARGPKETDQKRAHKNQRGARQHPSCKPTKTKRDPVEDERIVNIPETIKRTYLDKSAHLPCDPNS